MRYVDNPNGSVDDIAGVCNEGRNVVGLMPHPERACHPLLGSTDGDGAAALAARPAPARLSAGAVSSTRLMPARLSTAGSTPSSRHAA